MFVIQPPLIMRYFSSSHSRNGDEVFRRFYLSWEDALWHLSSIYDIKPGATIMVPEFFCGNVIEHMQEHGLKVIMYPVDQFLTTSYPILTITLQKIKPDILIIFHPVGITNKLMEHQNKLITLIPKNSLFIEDCVHKVVDHQSVKLLHNRHFLIDSLRKVVPIQGSFLYSKVRIPKIGLVQSISTSPYRLGMMFWWFAMQVNLLLAYISKNPHRRTEYNLIAERKMLRGYELIGKSHLGSPGPIITNKLAEHLVTKNIMVCKVQQFNLYKPIVQLLTRTRLFWLPTMKKSDRKNLRGFPLIIHLSVADTFLQYLRNKGVIIRFELNDSLWSRRQKIVYLPMGIHLNNEDIAYIVSVLSHFLSNIQDKRIN